MMPANTFNHPARPFPLAIFCVLLSLTTFPQKAPADFTSVDSFAKTIRYKGNLDTLTRQLTARYSKPLLKTRAIFIWITDNIRYDYRYYNKVNFNGKEEKAFSCTDDENCAARQIAWETKYVDRVLRKKKAVCEGYALLFQKMCRVAGIRAEIIPGYSRSKYYQVGTPGTLDHAWNAVWIESSYFLLDPTWAAGGCMANDDGKLLFFQKKFNDYYWLTPPADFVRNHYPQDSTWTLIPRYTKQAFTDNPYYLPSEIAKIQVLAPSTGVITAKRGDTLRFKLEYLGRFHDLQINSNIFRNPDIWTTEKISWRKSVRRLDTAAVSRQQYVQYRKDGNIYEFEYVVADSALYYLDILFDRERILRFDVHITQ
jgi:Transglutaminase-like superfamily